MPTWLIAASPVALGALLALLGGVFVQLRDHHTRLVRLETKLDWLLDGFKVVSRASKS